MKMFPVPMTRLFCILSMTFTRLAGTISIHWLYLSNFVQEMFGRKLSLYQSAKGPDKLKGYP